ncbi:MAG TPA: hypothetical protein VGO40_16075 [Longimicrobium sp.]|nr:hypothetical protein [Longimicrobium sp.]
MATVLAVAGIAALLVVPEARSLVGALLLGALQFLFSAVGGAARGWSAMGGIAALWETAAWSEPIVVGMLGGLLMSWFHRARRLRLGRRAKDSLVAAALSGDSAARAIVTFEAFVINLLAAYVVAGLLESVGGFHAAGAGALETAVQMHALLAGGGGAGGDFASILLQLIVVLLALLGVLIGFGMVIGLCAGAPAGAIVGALSWNRAIDGATRSVTLGALERRPKPWRWIASAAIRGGTEGLLSGGMVAAALGLLHVAGAF